MSKWSLLLSNKTSSYKLLIPIKIFQRQNSDLVNEKIVPYTLKDRFNYLKQEIPKAFTEFTNRHRLADYKHIRHGDYKKLWSFKDNDTFSQWQAYSDSSFASGSSSASIKLSPDKTLIFSGHIDTTPPPGVDNAGFCTLASPVATKSFGRKSTYDWSDFNTVVLRIRGDGRAYLITIPVYRRYDVNHHDCFQHSLYTRGGPYWQVVKIPFSVFWYANKGRVKNKQEWISLADVESLRITVMDGIEGPFRLEVDYISLMKDVFHNETFRYEKYFAMNGGRGYALKDSSDVAETHSDCFQPLNKNIDCYL